MTQPRPTIDLSIVIVNWNTREVLRQCLDSVQKGLGQLEAEILVVDNGSTDGSCELVRASFPQVRLIANAENRGFAAANNQGIRLAQGRYVLLLNSDTLLLGSVLSESLDYMDRHADVGVLGCRVLNADRTVQLTCNRFPTVLNLLLLTSGLFRCRRPSFLGRYQMLDWDRDSERDVDTVTGCYMFVRRQALEHVGLLDEAFFFYGEETDWCRRFWNAGWRLRFAPIGEIVHYGSLSSRKCNHRRDLMLTSGLVRFHRKHSGLVTAAAVWMILWVFNVLRAGYWAVRSLLPGRGNAHQRRDHFLGVVREYGSTWPRVSESAA